MIKLKFYFPLWLLVFSYSANATLHTFTLKHRQAADIIPIIQPLLLSTTTITGQGFELFIDGDENEKQKVMKMLGKIDTAATQYHVEVRILDSPMSASQLSQNHLEKTVNQDQPPVKIIKYHSQISDPKHHLYNITVIENTQAFVATGENFPNNQLQNSYGSFIPTTGRTQLNNGFYLIVSRQGVQQVVISLSAQQQQRQSQYGSSVTSSTTSTKIRASLRQWVLVASSEKQSNLTRSQQSRSTSLSSTRYKTTDRKNQSRWYYIRVSTKESL